MIVDFSCADGTVREAYFASYTEVCAIGEAMEFEAFDGMRYHGTRLPAGGLNTKARDTRFFSRQIRRWHPDAPHHTKEGWAAFQTTKEKHEFLAKEAGRGRIWEED